MHILPEAFQQIKTLTQELERLLPEITEAVYGSEIWNNIKKDFRIRGNIPLDEKKNNKSAYFKRYETSFNEQIYHKISKHWKT